MADRPVPPWQEQPAPPIRRDSGADVIACVLVDAQLGDGFWADPLINPGTIEVWREAHRARARPVVAALRDAGWLDPQQADDLRALDVRDAEVERLGAEVDRMRPVVEAAQAWREVESTRTSQTEHSSIWLEAAGARVRALIEAVDTFSRPRPILLSGQTMGGGTDGRV